jgi:hypothetical protein
MKTLILTITTAAALLALGAGTAAGDPSTAACTSGNTTYGGVRARVYCGRATATVKVGARTLSYRGGSCMRNRDAIELGIGTVILDAREPKGPLPRSFGISVGRIFGIGKAAPRDGTYTSLMLAFVDRGKRYASMQGKAVLGGGRSRGTFSGRLLTGEAVSGSFRCA